MVIKKRLICVFLADVRKKADAASGRIFWNSVCKHCTPYGGGESALVNTNARIRHQDPARLLSAIVSRLGMQSLLSLVVYKRKCRLETHEITKLVNKNEIRSYQYKQSTRQANRRSALHKVGCKSESLNSDAWIPMEALGILRSFRASRLEGRGGRLNKAKRQKFNLVILVALN